MEEGVKELWVIAEEELGLYSKGCADCRRDHSP
jgi:hypothetical protein